MSLKMRGLVILIALTVVACGKKHEEGSSFSPTAPGGAAQLRR